MKELIVKDDYGVFADNQETARVDSLYVAKFFSKNHFHVLRDIETLDCSDEFRQTNFGLTSYKDEQGKKRPCYTMTRDGFTFLVMGYRGKKAAKFKELYIQRFNEMEKTIKSLVEARQDFPLLTETIRQAHEEPKPYHYTNEMDMINRLVLGMSARQYREAHGIPKGESIRPHLTKEQLKQIDTLQKVDVGFVLVVPEFEKRKEELKKYLEKSR
jgi:Rha family phage regulatory protein